VTFEDLIRNIKKTTFEEDRFDQDDYLEFVIPVSSLSEIHTVLEPFFGLPFKRPGSDLGDPMADFMKRFGGIRQNQTLYFIQKDNIIYFAMF